MIEWLSNVFLTITWWEVIGYTGQFLFASSFIVQWIASERRQESVIPIAFWYLRMSGGLILLSYAFSRQDPVFILGLLFNSLVYGRNLYFIHSKARETSTA